MTTESTPPNCVPAARRNMLPWANRVAETQMRQFLIAGDVLAAVRAAIGSASDREQFSTAARRYTNQIEREAADLGAADRLEMTRRLGPVFPGQRYQTGGQTLTRVYTAALLHAAFDDVRGQMTPALRRQHEHLGSQLADLDRLVDQFVDDSQRRVADALAPTWTGTLHELADTVGGIA